MACDLELLMAEARGTAIEQHVAAVVDAAVAHNLCAVCLDPDTSGCEYCSRIVCPAHSRRDDEGIDFCLTCWEAC